MSCLNCLEFKFPVWSLHYPCFKTLGNHQLFSQPSCNNTRMGSDKMGLSWFSPQNSGFNKQNISQGIFDTAKGIFFPAHSRSSDVLQGYGGASPGLGFASQSIRNPWKIVPGWCPAGLVLPASPPGAAGDPGKGFPADLLGVVGSQPSSAQRDG